MGRPFRLFAACKRETFQIGKLTLAKLESRTYLFPYWKVKEAIMDGENARTALRAANQSERRLAGKARWPLWRHALFGAVEALLVLAWGLPTAAMAACIVVAMALLGGIVADDRKRYGFYVSGWSSRAARPAALLAGAICLVGLAVIVLTGGPNTWTPYVPIVAIGVLLGCTAASLWWERLYRAELGGCSE